MENGDPLDDLIEAGCRLLALPVEPAWKPAVRAHLEVTLRQARLLEDFVLPDDIDPAAVYRP